MMIIITAAERARRVMFGEYAEKAGRASAASARHYRLTPLDRRRAALTRRGAVLRRGAWRIYLAVTP